MIFLPCKSRIGCIIISVVTGRKASFTNVKSNCIQYFISKRNLTLKIFYYNASRPFKNMFFLPCKPKHSQDRRKKTYNLSISFSF
ncbi:unnamed protein product [Callosobruchus maculatus]|uniref:Uncharacterized protein n=1 Tax=Callosobruchus maculatus TaxID=64391 RepID=A0A653BLK0_CALMS|nr:unnamed protein product [Callosobruchus maculatus]